jgi:hypothetical protein
MIGPILFSTANVLHGQGVKCCLRPEGRSGCVTTPTTFSRGHLINARNVTAEASDEPIKITRIMGLEKGCVSAKKRLIKLTFFLLISDFKIV